MKIYDFYFRSETKEAQNAKVFFDSPEDAKEYVGIHNKKVIAAYARIYRDKKGSNISRKDELGK